MSEDRSNVVPREPGRMGQNINPDLPTCLLLKSLYDPLFILVCCPEPTEIALFGPAYVCNIQSI